MSQPPVSVAAPEWTGGAKDLPLPLVSIVVVNFNYARYLPALMESVRAQTYPHIESIVVDDASTDDSCAVLDAIEAGDAGVAVIRRRANGGQTAASLDGLAAARGAYVVFVDGDDLLLPRCVEAHVYAHLSLRIHVGFTSGDMLQFVDEQVVLATGEEFNRYVRSGRGRKADALRPFLGVPGGDPVFRETAARLEGRIHLVPALNRKWVWSPTSGNCYRRDALRMFADNPALADLRANTDMYFAHGIGALCGSALIDEPVFAYRLHGANVFSQRAQLNRTLPYRPNQRNDHNDRALLAVLDHFVGRADRFATNVWLRLNLVALLIRFDGPDADPALPRWQRRSRLARRLVENDGTVRAALGPWLTGFLRLWSGALWRHA